MWKPEIPMELYATMDERYVYEAFRDYWRVSDLPEYEREGIHYSDECIEKILWTPISLLADELWCALEYGHGHWLAQPEVKTLMHSEKCANCLNAFAPRFELVGAEVYNIWAKKAQKLFAPLGVPFGQSLDVTEYKNAMSQMEEHDFSQPLLMNCIFVINRRRFVEDTKTIYDKGDVLRYLLNNRSRRDDDNFLFRQARQIIQANGNLAPIEW